MKVRVERRRRGSRKPEISYVEAGITRPRPGAPRAAPGAVPDDAADAPDEEAVASYLRLPWRLNRGPKHGP